MKNRYKLFLLGTASLLFISCESVRTLVNKQFPPISATDQQYASITDNLRSMDTLNPHIGVYIHKGMVQEYLPDALKKAAENASDQNIVIKSVTSEILLDKQGILTNADFLIDIPEYHAEIKGTLAGLTAVATRGDTVYLRSALQSLKIKNITFTQKTGLHKRALAKLISPILKHYIDNINGMLFKNPVVFQTNWEKGYSLDPTELFKDPNTEVIAEPKTISRAIKGNAVLITTEGISVLAELTAKKSAPVTLPKTQTAAATASQVSKLFAVYNTAFTKKWQRVFEPVPENSAISVQISKAEIAGIFNEALSAPIVLKQQFTLPEMAFNEKLEVKRGDIDCQKVRTNFKYPDFNGASCNWNCMRRVLGVRVEDPVCAATRRACRLRVEAERIAWQAARETARIAHQVENEAKVAACNVQREAMDFMSLGKFKGSVSGSGAATVNFNSFRFNEDLSELTLQYSGDVNAKLQSQLELNPTDLGYVFFCYSNYGKNTSSNVSLSIPQATNAIAIGTSRDQENVLLTIKPEKIDYTASINPSPLHSLLSDPRFAVQCPISSLIGAIAAGAAVANFLDMIKLAPEQELLLMGKTKGKYGIDAVTIPFKPIVFRINGSDDKKAFVYWNAHSIQFTHYKADTKNNSGNMLATLQPNTKN